MCGPWRRDLAGHSQGTRSQKKTLPQAVKHGIRGNTIVSRRLAGQYIAWPWRQVTPMMTRRGRASERRCHTAKLPKPLPLCLAIPCTGAGAGAGAGTGAGRARALTCGAGWRGSAQAALLERLAKGNELYRGATLRDYVAVSNAREQCMLRVAFKSFLADVPSPPTVTRANSLCGQQGCICVGVPWSTGSPRHGVLARVRRRALGHAT